MLTNGQLVRVLSPLERSVLVLAARHAGDAVAVSGALRMVSDAGVPGRAVLSAEEVGDVLVAARRKVELAARRDGKSVTLTQARYTEGKETAMADAVKGGVSFRERIRLAADEEIAGLLGELADLTSRAAQVAQVLGGLGIETPQLSGLLGLPKAAASSRLPAGWKTKDEWAAEAAAKADGDGAAPTAPPQQPAAPPAAAVVPVVVRSARKPRAVDGSVRGKVIEALIAARAPLQLGEVVKASGASQPTVSARLREMIDEGSAEVVGKPKTRGARYRLRATQKDEATVREFVISRRGKGAFTNEDVFEGTGVPRTTIGVALRALAERAFVVSGPEGHRYNPPAGPGRAAEIDAAARAAAGSAVAAGGPTDPVPGTGKEVLSGDRTVQDTVNMVRRAPGWAAGKAGSGHIVVTGPEGVRIVISSTPGKEGAMQDRARLRRAGLPT